MVAANRIWSGIDLDGGLGILEIGIGTVCRMGVIGRRDDEGNDGRNSDGAI